MIITVVSILVLLDHTLWQCECGRPKLEGSEFQSLFCWITPSGLEQVFARMLDPVTFQSLFCWITPSGRVLDYIRKHDGQRFQSLFCWITPSGTSGTCSPLS